MIKYFMTSAALTRGNMPKGDPGEKGVTPFPGEEAGMMIYSAPPFGKRRMSNLHLVTPTHCHWYRIHLSVFSAPTNNRV
jgi:hypothetical protein